MPGFLKVVSMMNWGSVGGMSNGGSMGNWMSVGDWVSVGNWSGSNLGHGWGVSYWSNGLDNSWSRTVNDSIESIDWVSSVGDGTNGTIRLNQRVLSLDNISVTGFSGGLGISGQTVGNGVSETVLWMWVIRFWGNGNSYRNPESEGQ